MSVQLQIIEYPHIYNFVDTYKITLSIQQLDIHSLYTCILGSKYTSSLNIGILHLQVYRNKVYYAVVDILPK